MLLVLLLNGFERSEQDLSLDRLMAGCPQSIDHRTLTGDLLRAFSNVPLDHGQLAFVIGHRP